MVIAVPILIIVVLLAAAIVIGIRITRRNNAVWQHAAQILGIEFIPSTTFKPRRISGRVGPIDMVVDTYTEQHGKSSTTYTRYRAGYPDLNLGLKVRKQTGLHKLGKHLGMQDIETGDQGFDDAAMIKGNHPDAVRSFLTPSRIIAIGRLLTSYSGVEVTDSRLEWRRRGVETNPEDLVSTTRRLAAAAGVIAGGSEVADRALAKQQSGDLDAAATDLAEEIQGPGETDVETRMTGAATLYAAGRRDEAAAVLRELDREIPGDEEISGWLLRAERESTPSPAAPGDVGATALAEDLFGRDEMSFETMTRFEDRYRGARVRWNGTVNEIASSRETDGRRLVIGIATVAHDLYGKVSVGAVLDLPGAEVDRFGRGDTVVFSGVLATCDPLLRNVYLDDALIQT